MRVPSIEFQQHRLENGLQILLHRDQRVPLVHLTLHYRVGSSFETPGRSGFAHLFEHMMFQGSENVPKNEHGRLIDSGGGVWNASTNKDRTNYFETVPSHYLDLGLWLEAERMRSLQVSRENFENQRQTVIEEKKQSYDNRPYGPSHLRFDALAYENWAYGHPVIGSVEDLKKASLGDAQEFHRTYYGPDNAVLVLSGDLEEDPVMEKVHRFFGPIDIQTSARPPNLEEPEQKQEKSERLEDPLAVLPLVGIGYHMPSIGSPEYYALSMLALILAFGDSSRLNQNLLYQRNWITQLFAGPNEYKGPQLFNVWFQTQAEVSPEEVLAELDGELERVRTDSVSEQELEKARNQTGHEFVSRLSTNSQIGESLARSSIYFEDPQMINEELTHYLEVTPEGMREAARRIFRRENRSVLQVMPGKR